VPSQKGAIMMNRRTVLRSLALAPVVLLASRFAFAKDAAKPAAAGGKPANALGTDEPLAKAMRYVEDASKAGAERADKKANCANCAKYNKCAPSDKACKPVAASAAYAPCEIFSSKVVAKPGWCMSWTKA
jgi:hypothetical protein